MGPDMAEFAARVAADFRGRAYLAVHHLYRGDDARRLAHLARLGEATGLPLVATNDVLYHLPERRPLQDVLTCIREGCTIAEAGYRLAANAERHLKSPQEMARLFRGREDAVERSLEIVERCRFSLDELRYEYPEEPVRKGRRRSSASSSSPGTGPLSAFPRVSRTRSAISSEHELQLIERLDYARYFLTVHDIVRFARQRGILCQGRGSAANSAVCYCLGITAVDPARIDVLFERFISAARNEPPDIDVDFEHERREEVIQYIYEKYGRDRAGLAAAVICYRSRSAIREVGKALGLSVDVVAALAGIVWGWSNDPIADCRVREAGLDPTDRTLRLALDLAAQLVGFPRHLSQHVGGFVITRGPLSELVPIENAAMEDRTVIEWDKDDLDRARHPEDRRAGARHADLHPAGLRADREALWLPFRARHHAGRGPRGLRDAVPRRFARRLPGRKPRPDDDAAAAEAARVLRSRHRGGDRAAGPDPGRHGASLSAPALRARSRSTTPPRNCARCWARPWACRCSRSRR